MLTTSARSGICKLLSTCVWVVNTHSHQISPSMWAIREQKTALCRVILKHLLLYNSWCLRHREVGSLVGGVDCCTSCRGMLHVVFWSDCTFFHLKSPSTAILHKIDASCLLTFQPVLILVLEFPCPWISLKALYCFIEAGLCKPHSWQLLGMRKWSRLYEQKRYVRAGKKLGGVISNGDVDF